MIPILKQKFKRLVTIGSIFALFSLAGIGIGASSMIFQNSNDKTTPLKQIALESKPFSNFLLSLTDSQQKTYYVLGSIFGIMGGFCFAAASALKRQSED